MNKSGLKINNYSRNKITNYEKYIKTTLYGKDIEKDKNRVGVGPDPLIKDMARQMSEIASDKRMVNKYLEKKLKYLIKRTIRETMLRVKLISDYEKTDKNEFQNSRIGLKLSPIEKVLIQDHILREGFLTPGYFYEISLKNQNHNKEELNGEERPTRNFCVHFVL